MKTTIFSTLCVGLIGITLLASAGCDEKKRIDDNPPVGRETKIDVPGADIRIEGPATPVVPRSGDGVDVNVGPGGVQVDVDGAPLRERIRERREEAKESATP
ncbi:MAG TPA: hypothetical protein VGN12_11270 [Pirellulales bacterium]|jgi:hypothetical protein